MRKLRFLVPALVFALALPLWADSKHQSYFTFDEGGTLIRQAGDDEGVEAAINIPVFPGDVIETDRRGRSEIMLADGNILALDRSTTIRFLSILDSYEGEDEQTIVELQAGLLIVHRLSEDSTPLRLDTVNASYVSSEDAIYGVDSDGRGRDIVSVYEGTLEVRTPFGDRRLRRGQQATIDDRDIETVSLAYSGINDFERWYLDRAEGYRSSSSRYLDRRLAYADRSLNTHGTWIYVDTYRTHVWRPHVSIGWRPYHYGRWVHSRYGGLVWVSSEPWGWVPYHYGRWSYMPHYGWVWLPGGGYSHAWVYWAYGPSYIGWVPSGWYDCYPPYYAWGYNRHRFSSFQVGFGFHGRVRLWDTDLTPWTFVTPDGLVSRRIDRAALTTDAIRGRLTRGDGSLVTGGIRLTRDEIKDPASAVSRIARRGIGSGTGNEGSGSTADLTPFFRRDPELSTTIKERLTRGQTADSGRSALLPSSGGATVDRSVLAPSASPADTAAGRLRRGGEQVAPKGTRTESTQPSRGTVWRGATPRTTESEAKPAPAPNSGIGTIRRDAVERKPVQAPEQKATPERRAPARDTEWRRPAVERPTVEPRSVERPAVVRPTVTPRSDSSATSLRRENWRQSSNQRSGNSGETASTSETQRREPVKRATPPPRAVPRQVIDGIGGVRVTPRVRESGSPPRTVSPRTESKPAERPAPSRVQRPAPKERSAPARVERPAKESSKPAPSKSPSRSRIKKD
ncbi:MAG TPA: DUF6600 domain-containing protein [Thermoanaerobaculia bacterium]|nr:DUF6600 domain-containing protein [Thermoanaerobaculia bacterium]